MKKRYMMPDDAAMEEAMSNHQESGVPETSTADEIHDLRAQVRKLTERVQLLETISVNISENVEQITRVLTKLAKKVGIEP